MTTTPQSQIQGKGRGKEDLFESIWRNLMLVLVVVLIYCLPGFLSFQQFAIAKGYNFVRVEAWVWTLAAFIVYGTAKYGYFYLVADKALQLVHQKYQGEERTYRAKNVSKLSFDFGFYLCASVCTFYCFGGEYWFPSLLGGQGKCDKIYEAYPDWPSKDSRNELQVFYMLQLGVRLFSIFQIVAIRRGSYRKYYEFLLHHFIACTLILFSLLTNMLAVGTVILFLHDASDMLIVVGRLYMEAKYRNPLVDIVLYVTSVTSWFYIRLVVFPCCVIKEIYLNLPTAQDQWHGIWFENGFLLALNCVLVAMHSYWWFHMVLTGYRMGKGKGAFSSHDSGKAR